MNNNYEVEGQLSIEDIFNLDTWCGKMSQELLVATKEKTLESYSKKQQKLQMKLPLFLDLRKGNGHIPDASWQTDGVSLGDYMTHSTGVCLNEEKESVLLLTSGGALHQKYYLNYGEKPLMKIVSKLSQILEINPDPKYNLSAKACQGILRRAENRGKELPKMLKKALERQAEG